MYEYQPFNRDLTLKIVDGYIEMVQERIAQGYQPYILTILFREIRGPRNGVITRMLENTDEAYRRCLKRVVRNPRSPSQAHNLPIWICSPDFPVPKEAKNQLRDVALNVVSTMGSAEIYRICDPRPV